jgi:trans-aconitate 2-methyltransferase
MPTWDASQYLRFADERTRPCRDLIARIDLDSPKRIIDLGCGPGNSTDEIMRRWPNAEIVGLDSSAAMIAKARQAAPKRNWMVSDIRKWAQANDAPFDIVFSNAAMQWVDDHAEMLPLLMKHVSSNGALAIQMPCNYDAPAHTLMRSLAASTNWRNYFPNESVREWHVQDTPFYFDTLLPHASRLDLWQTEYIHILPSAEAIVEWYKGSGLRPFLDALPNDELRQGFLADYLDLIRPAFPQRASGQVLFPFRRLFIVAYK